jgi:AcrR family transcriptional regulator
MRNAEATRERILEAALAEFSAHGIAGARVDRIARTARCNKNLIYIYFDDKETLFATVLRKHLLRIHEEQPFTPDDLATRVPGRGIGPRSRSSSAGPLRIPPGRS